MESTERTRPSRKFTRRARSYGPRLKDQDQITTFTTELRKLNSLGFPDAYLARNVFLCGETEPTKWKNRPKIIPAQFYRPLLEFVQRVERGEVTKPPRLWRTKLTEPLTDGENVVQEDVTPTKKAPTKKAPKRKAQNAAPAKETEKKPPTKEKETKQEEVKFIPFPRNGDLIESLLRDNGIDIPPAVEGTAAARASRLNLLLMLANNEADALMQSLEPEWHYPVRTVKRLVDRARYSIAPWIINR